MRFIDKNEWPATDYKSEHPLLRDLLDGLVTTGDAAILDEEDLKVLPNRDWANVEQRLRQLADRRGIRVSVAKRWMVNSQYVGEAKMKALGLDGSFYPSFLFVKLSDKPKQRRNRG